MKTHHIILNIPRNQLQTETMGTITVDSKGRIETINAAFVKMTGYSAGACLGKSIRPVSEFFNSENFSAVLSGAVWSGNFPFAYSCGTEKQVSLTVLPVLNTEGVLERAYFMLSENQSEPWFNSP